MYTELDLDLIGFGLTAQIVRELCAFEIAGTERIFSPYLASPTKLTPLTFNGN